MKDLILIGTYCPDKERIDLLNNLVDSLQNVKEHFDILISSHTKIPEYILDKIDYLFYDKNNELIYDLNYINQPWFSPTNGNTIYSTYTTGYSTYLAVYRLLIGGLGLAKTMGYSKVHYVEYDTAFNSYDELFENNNLLNDYGCVNYKKEFKNFENNLAWGIGNFMSINVNRLDKSFLEYNKENLLSLIENSYSKTNERITEEILSKHSLFTKDYNILENKVKVNLSSNTQKDELSYWVVPFYNPKNNTVDFVCWNNKTESPINVNVIVNNERFLSYKNVNKFEYYLDELGSLDNIDSILVLINNKVKLSIDFKVINKQDFIKTNYLKNENLN